MVEALLKGIFDPLINLNIQVWENFFSEASSPKGDDTFPEIIIF